MKFIEGLTAAKVIAMTHPYDGEKPPKLSPLGGKCVKEISGNFGCQEHSVAKLVSALIGEDLTVHLTTGSLEKGTAVVLLKNPNSHNYPLNKVLVVSNGDYCVNEKGEEGNYAPLDNKGAWRKATKAEILKAFGVRAKKPSTAKVPVKKAKKR